MTRIPRLFPVFLGGPGAVGLLVLRLVAGTAMMFHGWPKIQHATSWMGPKASVPGVFQALAALAEFGGGLCWVLGLLTPLASFLILCNMAVALGMVHLPQGHPFVASQPGGPSYEPALGYLAIAVALLLIGPGKLSLDSWLFGRGRMEADESPDPVRAVEGRRPTPMPSSRFSHVVRGGHRPDASLPRRDRRPLGQGSTHRQGGQCLHLHREPARRSGDDPHPYAYLLLPPEDGGCRLPVA